MKRLLIFFLVIGTVTPLAAVREKKPGAIDYYNYLAYRLDEKGDKAGAAQNFLLYLEEPMKRNMTEAQRDSLYEADRVVYDQAAVNAMYLFYSVNDMDGVLKVLPYGRRITKPMTNVYITSMEAAKEKGMNSLYIELLKEAVTRFPPGSNFTSKLLEYYDGKMQNGEMTSEQVIADIDSLLQKCPKNAELWYIKGVIHYNAEKPGGNTAARSCFSKAIAFDETHGPACAAMGNTYLKDVALLRLQGQFSYVFSGSEQQMKQSVYKKQLAEVQTYYFNARTYLEMARQLMPEAHEIWGKSLLECYKMLKQQDKYDALAKEMEE